MPKTYTRRATRRYKPYKKTYAKKASNKRIATIAKQAVMRVAETKENYRVISGALYNDQYFFNNVLAQLTNGDSSTQKEGDKIFMKSLSFKGFFQPALGSVASAVSNTYLRLMLVASEQEYTNPIFNWAAFNNDLNISGEYMNPHWNRKRYQILKNRMYVINTDSSAVDLNYKRKYFTFNYNFNRNIQFREGSVYTRFKQYYLIAAVYNQNNGTTTPTSFITVAGSLKLSFKDF